MGTNVQKAGKEWERTGDIEKSLNKSQVSGSKTNPGDSPLIDWVTRKLKEIYGGSETYTKKTPVKNKAPGYTDLRKKPVVKTMRTKQVESGLKQAGLSDKDIERFK